MTSLDESAGAPLSITAVGGKKVRRESLFLISCVANNRDSKRTTMNLNTNPTMDSQKFLYKDSHVD